MRSVRDVNVCVCVTQCSPSWLLPDLAQYVARDFFWVIKMKSVTCHDKMNVTDSGKINFYHEIENKTAWAFLGINSGCLELGFAGSQRLFVVG